ncbi:MAG: rRNA maturation RNase YbeY [Chitinophagaceae bacterium]|nr:rRNA maturation RNase YbeY [Chitinophagaceae bacterium]
MQKIQFYFHDRRPALKERKKLKLFIENMFRKEKRALETLSYIFCSDEYLLTINKEFLEHDFYTDVITFDMGAKSEPTVGEVYLSVDRIRENAKTEAISVTEELHRVIFHGALHLCGYKDKIKTDKKKMRSAENRYLELYFK